VNTGHSSPQQTVRRAHCLLVFLRALLHSKLDMARRRPSRPLPMYDLFALLSDEDIRHKRAPGKIYYEAVYMGGI
jgi:hypothetical protein